MVTAAAARTGENDAAMKSAHTSAVRIRCDLSMTYLAIASSSNRGFYERDNKLVASSIYPLFIEVHTGGAITLSTTQESLAAAACDIKDIGLAEIGRRRVAWAAQSMPVLTARRDR